MWAFLSCFSLSLLLGAKLKGLKAKGEKSEKIYCLNLLFGAGSCALRHVPAHALQGNCATAESLLTCATEERVLCPVGTHILCTPPVQAVLGLHSFKYEFPALCSFFFLQSEESFILLLLPQFPF